MDLEFENWIVFLEKIYFGVLNIFFVFEVGVLFVSECFQYAIHRNYQKAILNTTNSLSNRNRMYGKLFQYVLLKYLWINESVNANLEDYFNHLPLPLSDIDYDLMEELKCFFALDVENLPTPIESGVISIVYELELSDRYKDEPPKIGLSTSRIWLKWKRKNVAHQLSDAMEHIFFIRGLFLWYVDLLPIIESLKDDLNRELDYQRELTACQISKQYDVLVIQENENYR
jgi:hypothetical protein